LEEKGFQGQIFRRGILRVKIAVDLTIGFSESDAGTVKENVGSFSDITNPWAQNVGKLIVPLELSRFKIFTNNNQLVTVLFTDEQVLKIFERFKNMDDRGHPVMSLEAAEGFVSLKFHLRGGLKPSLLILYDNVSSIEENLERLVLVGQRIEQVQAEMKARNM
jgi:hypothetical protein